LAECRHDPRQVAVINAALGITGVVARDSVLERHLAGSVGLDFKLVGAVENLPASTKIGAWVK
jgi:hypothetical protein